MYFGNYTIDTYCRHLNKITREKRSDMVNLKVVLLQYDDAGDHWPLAQNYWRLVGK